MAKTLSLSLLISFTLLLSTFLNPTLSLCNSKDKNTLLQIKKSFQNPKILNSWQPTTDCCTAWRGVACDPKTNRVTSLSISGGLSGQIPPQVGDLPYLQTLILRNNTKLIGEIPISISNLSNLKFLQLDHNKLSGPIPKCLNQLNSLYLLDLSSNELTGGIPCTFSILQSLLELRLDNNKLNGTVLDLSGNLLVGDVSFLFGKEKRTKVLDLSRNSFAFDLSRVEFAKGLQWVDLSHNNLRGSLPVGLPALDLKHFDVSHNRLCGSIPVGGKLQGFKPTSFRNNQCLCGAPLPACD
ncbi:hypothetical protein UlMin_005201 [Ulmus minor]